MATYNQTNYDYTSAVTDEQVSFDMQDQSGRAVGYHITIRDLKLEEDADGNGCFEANEKFEVKGQPTRNGEDFGGPVRRKYAGTPEDAMRLVQQQMRAAKRRYAKKFAAFNA